MTSPSSEYLIQVKLDGLRQLFQEQIDFFKGKLNLPTERWDDIWQAAHDRAFVVAGAQKADLLNDLRAAVEKSIKGQSIGEFRKDFAAAVAKSGWTGWTGEGSKAGEAWRTRVIYQTNLASSYAAGRWAQLHDPELLKVRPFWRYIHNDSVSSPRPQHKAWGDSGLTLPHDHPFWLTHFPPNGWGCRCRVQAVRGPKAGDATEPPAGWDTIDPKTGAPVGIDKGWAYAPGASLQAELGRFVEAKVAGLPADLGRALEKDVASVLDRQAKVYETVDDFIKAGREITVTLPDGAKDPRGCYQALLDLLQKEVGIATPCKVSSSGAGAKLVKEASQLYPDAWTKAADDLGALYVKIDKAQNARGWQWTEMKNSVIKLKSFGIVRDVVPGTGWIVTSQNFGTAVHEYAHRLQSALPGLDRLFQDLHKSRTGGDPLEKLNVITPIKYSNNELSRKDKYLDPYQGKEYSHAPDAPALEVMTMAFQYVLGLNSNSKSRIDFEQLYLQDRNMFDFVVGLLRFWKP
ncbi:MAG: head morphoproteinis protein spp1 gp7 [Comamonadaceae bacterium]|nr:MAG: head morphoproteinis protein spp1 gp7 [Comamonadaceae bacterium]